MGQRHRSPAALLVELSIVGREQPRTTTVFTMPPIFVWKALQSISACVVAVSRAGRSTHYVRDDSILGEGQLIIFTSLVVVQCCSFCATSISTSWGLEFWSWSSSSRSSGGGSRSRLVVDFLQIVAGNETGLMHSLSLGEEAVTQSVELTLPASFVTNHQSGSIF